MMSQHSRAANILESFDGSIQPVKRPMTYHVAEFLVTVVMILLPLIYVGLIAVVGWGVYYHAANHTGILEQGQGKGRIMAVIVYLAPIVIGGIMIAFMFKPLFSRAKQSERDWAVDPDDEPQLFAFVNRICEIVKAPKPKRIDFDTNVNASASFRHGLLSMFGNDLVLTIGLPLVAGLNLRQFAGVLAHEFGHFSQGAGMRLTYIIRSISHWFGRVVYERDEWDDWLETTAKSIDLRLGWVLHLARFFVWLTRKILWGLMMVGHLVAGHLLRQMEFDADRYEARLAGSDTFESTMRAVTRLGYAQQAAMSDLGEFYSEGRLSDDFANLVVTRGDAFRPEQLAKIDQVIESSVTGWTDTHPADSDRIQNAHKEAASGIFDLEIPATTLLRDFNSTSKEYTEKFYREIFGEAFSSDAIVSNEQLLAWKKTLEHAREATMRVFQGGFESFKSLKIPRFSAAATVDLNAVKKELVAAREATMELIESYKSHQQEFEKAFENRINVDQAECLVEAGLSFKPEEFYVPLTERDQIEAEKANVAKRMEAATEKMAAFETAVSRRLAFGLGLAQAERVPLDDEIKQLVTKVDHLRGVLKRVDENLPLIDTVRHTTTRLRTIFNLLQANDGDEDIVNLLRSNNVKAMAANRAAYAAFNKIDYPFDHADDGITIAQYCVENLESDHPGEVYEAGDGLSCKVPWIRGRTIGTFCQIIEAVEKQLGLDPLPDPIPESDED